MSTKKKYFTFFLQLLGLIVSLYIVFLIVDVEKLLKILPKLTLPIIILALILGMIRQMLTALRWRLLNTDQENTLPYKHYFFYVMASSAMSLITPGIIGIDITRGALLGKNVRTNKVEQLASVLSDRVVGLFSALFVGTLATLIAPVLPHRWQYFFLLFGLLSFFIIGFVIAILPQLHQLLLRLFAKLPKIGEKLSYLLRVWQKIIDFYRDNPSRLLPIFLISFLIHSTFFTLAYLLALNLKLNLSFFTIMAVIALSFIVIALPISLLGLGVNELSFVMLLSLQNVSPELATALSLQLFFLNTLISLIGLPFLWFLPKVQHDS